MINTQTAFCRVDWGIWSLAQLPSSVPPSPQTPKQDHCRHQILPPRPLESGGGISSGHNPPAQDSPFLQLCPQHPQPLPFPGRFGNSARKIGEREHNQLSTPHPPPAQGQFRCGGQRRIGVAFGGHHLGLGEACLSLRPEEIRERQQEHGRGKAGERALLWGNVKWEQWATHCELSQTKVAETEAQRFLRNHHIPFLTSPGSPA